MEIVTVTAATPVVRSSGGDWMMNVPMTVAAIPGEGGTLKVDYQVVVDGVWTTWPSGTVSEKTISVLNGPVYALRFTAAVSTGTVELGS